MSQTRRARKEQFPVVASERTHVPVASKDFLSVLDLTHEELHRVLDLAAELKRDRSAMARSFQPLAGRHVALLFDKPSLRTRTTFTIAIRELGGEVIEPPADVAFGGRESVEDVARNLERWLDAAVVRTFAQERLVRFAEAAKYEHEILEYATEKLSAIEGVKIIGTAREKASVLSFIIENIHPHDIGTILDQSGIAIRAGHHCAQPVMQFFDVPATARASFAFYNTREEVEKLAEAVEKVIEVFA